MLANIMFYRYLSFNLYEERLHEFNFLDSKRTIQIFALTKWYSAKTKIIDFGWLIYTALFT